MPESAATVTLVAKLSTSTTTATTSAPDATAYLMSACAPLSPHSRRTTWWSWLCQAGRSLATGRAVVELRQSCHQARGSGEAVGGVDELRHLVPVDVRDGACG